MRPVGLDTPSPARAPSMRNCLSSAQSRQPVGWLLGCWSPGWVCGGPRWRWPPQPAYRPGRALDSGARTPPPGVGFLTVSAIAWGLLWLLVFSMPWEKSLWVPQLGTISHLLGILAFCAWAAHAAWRRCWRRPNLALVLAGMLVCWFAFTYVWSLDRPATLMRIKTFTELLILVWLIWNECRSETRQRQLLAAYVFGAAIAALMALWRYLHHQQTYYLRYAAPGFDPNDFGLILALSIGPAFYLARRGFLRGLAAAALAAIIPAILLTASRTAWVASLVALLFAWAAWRNAD